MDYCSITENITNNCYIRIIHFFRKYITCLLQDKEIKTYKTLVNKGAQTPRGLYTDETELFRKEVEASTMKLEESCKQMETFCEKIKTEKQELEQKYKLEKEAVKALKKRCQELEEQKVIYIHSHLQRVGRTEHKHIKSKTLNIGKNYD